MKNWLWVLVAALTISALAQAQSGSSQSALDPVFAKVPFDRWLAETNSAQFKWSVRVTGGRLTNFQRLEARVDVQLDGEELVKRKGAGELVFFVQLSDSAHRRYQTHVAIPLQQVTDAAAKSNVVYSQPALVLPGDYRVDVAILDAATGEHATAQRTLHVAALRGDSLAGAWRGLPPVEFLTSNEPPDAWFQPSLTGRLQIPLETRRPVRVEVLVNASPSAIGSRRRAPQLNTRHMENLLPALKVLAEIDLARGALNIALLDLTRRQVLFTQERVDPRSRPLDWPRLRPALLQADPNKIDVRELERRQQNQQFFADEVERRMRSETGSGTDAIAVASAGSPRVALIILGGPMDFESEGEVRPIQRAKGPQGKVFYIRYHTLPPAASAPFPGRLNMPRAWPEPRSRSVLEPLDGLEPLLRPFQPRTYDVYTPDQFRKALADLLKEISLM